MRRNHSYYVLFAGVNGAGKTTLFRSGLWQHGAINESLPRVNTDEILVAHGWDWNSQAAQIEAGKEAIARIKEHFASADSFCQETTLAGKSIVRNINNAKEQGYYIVIYFVGLEDPQIANERIEHRGSLGGHVVDPSLVSRRYNAALNNFLQIVDLCNEAYLFDNTTLLKLCARFEFGELAFYNEDFPQPEWVVSLLDQMGFEEVPFP